MKDNTLKLLIEKEINKSYNLKLKCIMALDYIDDETKSPTAKNTKTISKLLECSNMADKMARLNFKVFKLVNQKEYSKKYYSDLVSANTALEKQLNSLQDKLNKITKISLEK